MRAFRALVLFLAAGASAAPAQTPRLTISLADAEKAALAHSPLLLAAQDNLSAAVAQAEAQLSELVPNAALEGAVQYQSAVPRVSFVPGTPAVQFGSHNSYSVGPAVTYTLWDQGALFKAWRGQKALAQSQQAQRDLILRQVRLVTRLDYFQVQLALEQERSQADSLRLAEAQYRDISARFRAGASSRIDWLSAHQQVLDRRRDLRSAEADVAAALRALFAQTGQGQDVDVSAALDARIAEPLPAGVSAPTAVVELEPLESVEAALTKAASAPVDEAYPRLAAYARQSEAQRLSAQSIAAGLWPRLTVSYKLDYLYPELPLLRSVWQNTAAAGLSVPVFELGRTRSQARAQRALADASARQRDEAYDELLRDWHKARDQYAALRDEEELDRESVGETAEIARLRYASYRDGGSTILDVETANIDAVLARVVAARTRTQILIQLATLDSLSEAKVNP